MWTFEEDNILKENYSTMGAEDLLPLLPEKSLIQIKRRAGKFALLLTQDTQERIKKRRVLRTRSSWGC